MKIPLTAVCFLALAANLAAFELPAVNSAALRAAPAEAPAVPAARSLEDDMPHGAIPPGSPDWAELRAAFLRAEPVRDLRELLGVHAGALLPLYEREELRFPFGMAVYEDQKTGRIKAAFPMPPHGVFETFRLKLTPAGAEFENAWGGRARFVIRRSGDKFYVFSNLYSDETYGVFQSAGAGPWDPSQDFRAAKALEDDMIHGAIPGDAPVLTGFGPAEARPVPGVGELFGGLRADKASAQRDLAAWSAALRRAGVQLNGYGISTVNGYGHRFILQYHHSVSVELKKIGAYGGPEDAGAAAAAAVRTYGLRGDTVVAALVADDFSVWLYYIEQ